jgi:HEAT repeat protein
VNPTSGKREAQSLNEAVLLALSDLDRPQRELIIEEAAESADPERLVTLISADDAVRRNAALEALGRGGRRSVPALVRALNDPDPEVVMFAANTLGKTRDPTAIPYLVRVLRHGDVNVCQAAIESLGLLRASSTLDALDELLESDAWLRFSVVHTIGEIGHPSSVRTLLALLDDKQLHDVAVHALGKIGGPEVIAELVPLLQVSDSRPQFGLCLNALVAALEQVPDPAALQAIPSWVEFARGAQETVAPFLVDLLRPSPDAEAAADELATRESAIELIRCLRLESCYPNLIAAATDELLGDALLFAIADLGPVMEPYLTKALAHPDRQVRLLACRGVAAVMFEACGPAVTRLLADADEEVRTVAMQTLARLHRTEALGEMVACLADEARGVAGSAAEALGRMDARLVTLALLRSPEMLGDKRRMALTIMRDNPHPLQRGFLDASLGDPDEDVRLAAVAALVAQQGSGLVESLTPLLADPSLHVRQEVIAAIGGRRCERSRELLLAMLERDPATRGDAIAALGRVGDDRLVPRLISIFHTFTAAEQTQAVATLGALESAGAQPFLSRQLGHPDPNVRRHVVSALARIGTTPALQRLGVALRDSEPRVRMAVTQALASCPHPIARGALERLSLDPVASVAAAAREKLGR